MDKEDVVIFILGCVAISILMSSVVFVIFGFIGIAHQQNALYEMCELDIEGNSKYYCIEDGVAKPITKNCENQGNFFWPDYTCSYNYIEYEVSDDI